MNVSRVIKTRWSPRAFKDHSISAVDANLLFEAAKWAPSSMNEQPWKYYYSLKEDAEKFKLCLSCLTPGNKIWAKNASMLILSVAKKEYDYKRRKNRHAMHDTGAANVLLCLQANDMGYQAHQMGGFNSDKTYETFGIESDKYELVSFIAVGKPGDPSILPVDLQDSETKPRIRKDLKDFVTRIR